MSGTTTVRVHQELQVHRAQQRERLGQGDEPRGQREGAGRQGGRRDDRPHQGGRRLIALRAPARRERSQLDAPPLGDRHVAPPRPVPSPRHGAARRPLAVLGPDAGRRPTCSSSWSSCCTRSATGCGWRAIRQATSSCSTTRSSSARSSTRSSSSSSRINVKMVVALLLSGFFVQPRWWIKVLSLLFILPWAVPSIPTILSVRFMLNPEWGVINQLIFRLTGARRPELAQRPDARARLLDADAHLEVAAVLDPDPDRRPAGDPGRAVRSGLGRRRDAAGRSSASSPGRRCARSTSRRPSCR